MKGFYAGMASGITCGALLAFIDKGWLVSTATEDPVTFTAYTVMCFLLGICVYGMAFSPVAEKAGEVREKGRKNREEDVWAAISGLSAPALEIVREAYANGFARCGDDGLGHLEPLRRAGIVCGLENGYIDRDNVVLTVEASAAIKRHKRKFDRM